MTFSSCSFVGETSVPQQQKLHTEDNHNSSGSHGIPNVDLFQLRFLLVNYGKVFSANELPQNSNASSREENIP